MAVYGQFCFGRKPLDQSIPVNKYELEKHTIIKNCRIYNVRL